MGEAGDECRERGYGHTGIKGRGTPNHPAGKVPDWNAVSRLPICSLFLHPDLAPERGQ